MFSRAQLTSFLALAAVLIFTAGCSEPAPEGSAAEALDTAPPIKAEVPEPVAEEKTAAPADDATQKPEPETSGAANVDLRGMTFAAPEGWNRNPNPTFVEAEFSLPGDDGDARLTIMPAGGDKQANIDRWVQQFKLAEGDEPAVSDIDVDGKTASMVDIKGTFLGQGFRPTEPQDNYRMLGFIIPSSATDSYFVKVTGPEGTVEKHADAVVEFVKSGKSK